MSPLYLALVHHPVKARDGATVTTAVTNLDVHDLARLAKTYGARRYFVVTPIEAQRALVARILEHWKPAGEGEKRIPERTQALMTAETVASLAAARAAIEEAEGRAPRLVATAARAPEGREVTSFAAEADTLRAAERPTLLVFGTGHGLADEVLLDADVLLEPIRPGSYNHLSVRTAAAIAVDRLLGERS